MSEVDHPKRRARPADSRLQAFLKEVGLEQLEEPLWDESLYSCLQVLDAQGRVGFISWLVKLNVGPVPVRQKLTNALAKAQRANKFGHVTPPAWDYVPQMPAPPKPGGGRFKKSAGSKEGATAAPPTPPAARAGGPPSSPRTAIRPPPPSPGTGAASLAPSDREARPRASPSSRRYPIPVEASEMCAGSVPTHKRTDQPPPSGAHEVYSGAASVPAVAPEPSRLFTSVTNLWRRVTQRDYTAVPRPETQTPQQVSLGLL